MLLSLLRKRLIGCEHPYTEKLANTELTHEETLRKIEESDLFTIHRFPFLKVALLRKKNYKLNVGTSLCNNTPRLSLEATKYNTLTGSEILSVRLNKEELHLSLSRPTVLGSTTASALLNRSGVHGDFSLKAPSFDFLYGTHILFSKNVRASSSITTSLSTRNSKVEVFVEEPSLPTHLSLSLSSKRELGCIKIEGTASCSFVTKRSLLVGPCSYPRVGGMKEYDLRNKNKAVTQAALAIKVPVFERVAAKLSYQSCSVSSTVFSLIRKRIESISLGLSVQLLSSLSANIEYCVPVRLNEKWSRGESLNFYLSSEK